MKLIFATVCISLVLAGCAGSANHALTKYADYLPDEQQPVQVQVRSDLPPERKATVEFTTNTSHGTSFSLKSPQNMCGGFGAVETILVRRAFEYTEEAKRIRKIASLGILSLTDSSPPKYPHRVVKEFPAGEDIVVHADIFEILTNVKISCGPLYVKLRPEAGKTYRMSMESLGGQCRVKLAEMSHVNSPVVPPHSTWRCTPSLTGFDGNKVVRLMDYPGQ